MVQYFLTSSGHQTFVQRRIEGPGMIRVSIESLKPFLKGHAVLLSHWKIFVGQIQMFFGCNANFRILRKEFKLDTKEYLFRCKGSHKDFLGEDPFEVRLIVNESRIQIEYTIGSSAVFCKGYSELDFLNMLFRFLSSVTDYVHVTSTRQLIPI